MRATFAALLLAGVALPARAEAEACEVMPELPPELVTIVTDIPGVVFRGVERMGETPLSRKKLPAGCVELRTQSLDGSASRTELIMVEPNKTMIYAIRLAEGTLFVAPVLVGVAGPGVDMQPCRINPRVKHMEDEVARAEYDRASKSAARVLQDGSTCREDLIRVYYTQAVLQAIDNDPAGCRRAFEMMLALFPAAKLEDHAFPRLARCFEAALTTPTEARNFAAFIRRSAYSPDRAAFHLAIAVVDPLFMSSAAHVYFRRPGETKYARLVEPLAHGTDTDVRVPGLERRPGERSRRLEYYVAIVDARDNVLLSIGGVRTPLMPELR